MICCREEIRVKDEILSASCIKDGKDSTEYYGIWWLSKGFSM
jgi:hypothetical protein